jgi:hypothetical protein
MCIETNDQQDKLLTTSRRQTEEKMPCPREWYRTIRKRKEYDPSNKRKGHKKKGMARNQEESRKSPKTTSTDHNYHHHHSSPPPTPRINI